MIPPNLTPLTLYTIGHSNLTQEAFLELLRQHNITVVVDIRSAPYSQYVPHFNKKALEAFLYRQGVDYRYAGEYLGGRPKDEKVYKDEVIPDEGTRREAYLERVDYEAVMKTDWYRKGIHRLLQIVAETQSAGKHVVIMCSEGNPLDCHRHHLIARSLLDKAVKLPEVGSISVMHIVRGGDAQAVEESAFETKGPAPQQLNLF